MSTEHITATAPVTLTTGAVAELKKLIDRSIAGYLI